MTINLLPVSTLIPVLVASSAIAASWQANPDTVERAGRGRPEYNYVESRVPAYTLPDPLRRPDGTTVTSPESWAGQRQRVLELFREHVYGRSPGRPDRLWFEVRETNPAALGGKAGLRRIAIHSRVQDREHRFELLLFVPNGAPGKVPVFLLLNNRGRENTDPTRENRSPFWPVEDVIARGYGIAALQVAELAPDHRDQFKDGVIRLFEGDAPSRPNDAWAGLAAWGWGASRALDYLTTDNAIDAARVAVIGHSRGGKAALWAGAEDERFALVISNQSGCGGAALSRRRFGETVARINTSFPHWFCGNFKRYNNDEPALPVDQHLLVALLAPRAVAIGSADQDLWADPRGEFLSLAAASPVFALWGHAPIRPEAMPPLDGALHAGPRSYHVRRGPHNLTVADWARYLDFADTVLR